MVKLYGWKETIFSVLISGENFLLTGLSNALMVIFFLSGRNLSIFFQLNSAICRIGNAPNILGLICKEQNEFHPPFYLLFQSFQNYSRLQL